MTYPVADDGLGVAGDWLERVHNFGRVLRIPGRRVAMSIRILALRTFGGGEARRVRFGG